MSVSIRKVCISVAVCALTSACSGLPMNESKPLAKNNISPKTPTKEARPRVDISTETQQFLITALAIYGFSKLEDGVAIATLMTDYRKKQLEVEQE